MLDAFFLYKASLALNAASTKALLFNSAAIFLSILNSKNRSNFLIFVKILLIHLITVKNVNTSRYFAVLYNIFFIYSLRILFYLNPVSWLAVIKFYIFFTKLYKLAIKYSCLNKVK